MKKFLVAITVSVTVVAGTVGGNAFGAQTTGSPATTGEQTGESESGVHIVSELEANLGRVSASVTTGVQRERVNAYLEIQARSGRAIDINDISVTEVTVGQSGTFMAITPVGDRIREVKVATLNDRGDTRQLVGAIITQDNSGHMAVSATPSYDAGRGTNVSLSWNVCRSLWWDAEFSTNDHYVYDCVEKWRYDNRSWAYNRYTLFSPAKATRAWWQSPRRIELVDATIRTRPWKGYESRVTGGPYDYAPRPTSTCSEYTATIGLGRSGSGASLTVPFVNCNAKISVYPKATDHSMGTDWNGSTTGQVALDYAFRIATTTTPYYADYVWLEVQNCGLYCLPDAPSEYELWKDSGW